MLEGILELLKAGLNLVDRAFSVNFLLFESPDFLLDLLKVKLLLVHHFVSIIVLFLDLRKLNRDFSDFLSVVLLGSGIVGGVEKGVSFNKASGSIVNFKLLSHDLFKVA